jgi:GDP-4-dehydro-6-deoxy-D-mannose reductase
MGSGLRILVTGSDGFIGTRLLPFLTQRGHTCVASQFDLLDFPAIDAALSGGPWDAVIHLAAVSHVPTCERNPADAFRVNLAGTALLLEGIRRHAAPPWLVFPSTAQVYAAPSTEEARERIVIDETRSIAPQNVYARTKWSAELLAIDTARREGLAATVLRLFNHTHKSQSPDFFVPHLYQSILAAAGGNGATIPVGNLDLWRDIGSAHDLLRAFAAVLERPGRPREPEVFNVCSGAAKHLAGIAAELAGRLGARVEFIPDPERMRPGEPRWIQGSHDRLTAASGWVPDCRDERSLVESFLAERI